MNTKNYLCLLVLMAIGFTACTEMDDMPGGAAKSDVPVRLTATMKGPQLTRAALHLNEDALTSGTVSVRTSSDYTTAYSYTAGAGGVLSSDAPAFYPAGGANIDVVAYTPADAANATSNTFTVSADQTANAGYVASDLLWAGATSKNSRSGQVAMAFEHKMAKIIVRVTASDGVSHINSVTLKNVKRQCVFTYATGAISDVAFVSGENQDQVSVCQETPNTVSVSEGAACIPAQTLPADEFIVIGTSEGTAVYSLSEAKSIVAGSCYTMNIDVSAQALEHVNTITSWTNYGDFDIGPIARQTYTGSAITPALTVSYHGAPLTLNTHYCVDWYENVNVGTAYAVVKGLGQYSDYRGVSMFAIDKANPAPEYVPVSVGVSVTGNSSTAILTVNYAGDGTVTASSNNTSMATLTPLAASAGTATFTVTGAQIGRTTLNIEISEGTNHLAYSGSAVVPVDVVAYEFVDLGLPSGRKWARCNIGASSETDYGDYFSWGATEPCYSSQSPLTWKEGMSDGYDYTTTPYIIVKSKDDEGNYDLSLSKYYASDYEILQPMDDAATVVMGDTWFMPTKNDWNELFNTNYTVCTWENGSGSSGLSTGGVRGLKVAKKSDTSVYIFLPAAGYYIFTSRNTSALGRYWASDLGGNISQGCDAYFDSSSRGVGAAARCYGYSIRAVR